MKTVREIMRKYAEFAVEHSKLNQREWRDGDIGSPQERNDFARKRTLEGMMLMFEWLLVEGGEV